MAAAAEPGPEDLVASAEGVLAWHGGHYPCLMGEAGVTGAKREGDGATPLGCFALRRVLYRPDRLAPPATRLPVAALSPRDGWCDDPEDPLYNQQIRQPFNGRFEILWREDRLYDVIVVLGYNDAPAIPGRGSAIFLHVASPDRRPTKGCIALERAPLLEILKGCDPRARLCVIGGPGRPAA